MLALSAPDPQKLLVNSDRARGVGLPGIIWEIKLVSKEDGSNMYQVLFSSFENKENLSGKAWEHAVTLDFLNTSKIKDCSIHCFHYQQMFECFFKHILETKTEFGAYSKSHQLNKLLEEVISATSFGTDKSKYRGDLNAITVCAEEYRYNFDINCKSYFEMVETCDELLKELITFEKTNHQDNG